jgi:hypothetical protein
LLQKCRRQGEITKCRSQKAIFKISVSPKLGQGSLTSSTKVKKIRFTGRGHKVRHYIILSFDEERAPVFRNIFEIASDINTIIFYRRYAH